MSTESSAPVRDAREVSPHEWGRVVLEELLFRAAEAISESGPGSDAITLELPFTLTADRASRSIEIRTPGKVEQAIVTRVPLGD